MPYLIDVYALAPERSAAAVERFLAKFLPHRERADAEYVVHLAGGNPVAALSTPEELAQFCETHPEAEARAYWNSGLDGDPRSAHVFFLPAGGLVLGLSIAADNRAAWDRWLMDLLSFSRAKHGYWTGECPPEDTIAEFIAVAQRAHQER